MTTPESTAADRIEDVHATKLTSLPPPKTFVTSYINNQRTDVCGWTVDDIRSWAKSNGIAIEIQAYQPAPLAPRVEDNSEEE